MKNKGQKNERTTRVKSLILLVAFTAIMLIVSTYAWFSTQNSVKITNITGDVRVAEGLEISLDAASWSNSIDISTAWDSAYSGNTNHKPSILKPVSTTGAAGGTAVTFYSGTLTDTVKLGSVAACAETTEAKNDDTKNIYPGYYAFDVFVRNSSSGTADQQLAISKASSAIIKSGGDDATGLQNAVRVALAEYSGVSPVNDSATNIINAANAEGSKISQVAIWEPNSNYHVPHVVTNQVRYGMTDATVTAKSVMTTYALKGTDDITNVWSTTDTKLALQATNKTEVTFYTEDDPETEGVTETVNDVQSYETAAVKNLTDTAESAQNFAIAANKVTKLRVYVWIEGQDHDCIDYASHGGGVTVNLGLEKIIANS